MSENPGRETRRPAIVGMVQLRPLPGSPRHRGEGLVSIVDAALEEAGLLIESGFTGVQVQNMGDNPSHRHAGHETVSYMTVACHELRRTFPDSTLSVLVNWDAEASIAVGHACAADYVRIEHTFIGVSVTSWGMSHACCYEATRFRSRIGAEVPLYADLREPHAVPLVEQSIDSLARAAVVEGGADGLFVTGSSITESLDWIRQVATAVPTTPLWLGGGATAHNVGDIVPYVDGITVATSIKPNRDMALPVDPDLARAFIAAARP